MERADKNYAVYNAEHIRDVLKKYIDEMTEEKMKRKTRFYNPRPTLKIDRVYKELSIFDTFKNELSLSNLKDMYSFVNRAINLGFKGYVCFKVGASGCANGMWVHACESTNGYSPDGDCIYRSFTPDYVVWDAEINGEWLHDKYGDISGRNIKNIIKKEMLKNKEEE